MSATFDPYRAWLDIPADEQPPHYYRLLGISLLEADPAVINAAAERQTNLLKVKAVGPYVALSQQVCEEVAAARLCLLTPATKQLYDSQLKSRLVRVAAAPHSSLAVAAPLPLVATRPVNAATPISARPIPVQQPQPSPPKMNLTAPAIDVSQGPKPASELSNARSSKSNSQAKGTAGRRAAELAKVIAGGIAGVIVAVLILNYFVGIDPLGWSVSARKKEAAPKKVAAVKAPVGKQTIVKKSPAPPAELSGPIVPNPTEPSAADNSRPSLSPENAPPGNGDKLPKSEKGLSSLPPIERSPSEERSLADLTNPGPTSSLAAAKKSPSLSTAEYASKLAAIKDIYKAEFAAVKPGANPEFVQFLLTTATKVEGDSAARYVLYMEAFRQACSGSQFDTAAESLSKMETEFESEPFAPRYELLTRMAQSAKTNDARFIAAKGALSLLDHALVLGKVDEADKLARIADAQTKYFVNKEMRAQAVEALQTTSELLSDLKLVNVAQEKLAQAPDDPTAHLAIGRYRCLVEGNWPAGLVHLARGNDETIKTAAGLDLAGPSSDVTAGRIGDAWYEIAKEGKGQSFFGRADYWYQKGMETETGLVLVRLKQRREEISKLKLPPRVLGQTQAHLQWPTARELLSGGVNAASIDLLPLVISQTLMPQKGWSGNGGARTTPAAAQNGYAFFESSFPPPKAEYTMRARITRNADQDSKGRPAGGVMFGLTQKGKRFALVIDELAPGNQRVAYLTMGSATAASLNSSMVKYSRFRIRSDEVICNVANDKITVLVGGTQLLQYSGDMSALAIPPDTKNVPDRPFFYAQEFGINTIDRWSVGPLVK